MTSAATTVGALGEWRSRPGASLPERLAEALETALLDGRIGFVAPLPSERALAGTLGVSRATVTSAYGLLRAGGWLATRQGARPAPVIPATLDEGLSPRDGLPAGGDVIDLTVAGPAGPAGAYLAALAAAGGRIGPHVATTGLSGPGLPELRARLAERHARAGLPTAPEEILLTTGAIGALQLALAALLPVRAAGLAELPTYPRAIDALRDRGRPVVGWPISDDWDVERFTALVGARGVRVAYVIGDFHNPTGRLMPARVRAELAAAAERLDVQLVVDETMRELDLREGVPRPEPPLATFAPSAVTLGSLSKVLWGGLRIGWVRAPRATIERLERHPLAPALAASPLEQLVALELLDDLDALVERRRATLRRRCEHLLDALRPIGGLEVARPAGGLSTWLTLPPGVSSLRVAAGAARLGVRLTPGGRFSPDAPLDRHLRIPFALPEPLLDRALERIRPLLSGT